MGCGTIIDPDGTILTCAHVVVDTQGPRTIFKRKVRSPCQLVVTKNPLFSRPHTISAKSLIRMIHA